MLSEVNYVTISITSTSINIKQNEEEVDSFAKQVEKLALHVLSYSSLEITVEKYHRVAQSNRLKDEKK